MGKLGARAEALGLAPLRSAGLKARSPGLEVRGFHRYTQDVPSRVPALVL